MYINIYYTVKSDNFLWFDFILPQGFAFDNNFLLNIYSYISPLVNQLSNRLIVIWYYVFLQFRQFYNTNLVLFFIRFRSSGLIFVHGISTVIFRYRFWMVAIKMKQLRSQLSDGPGMPFLIPRGHISGSVDHDPFTPQFFYRENYHFYNNISLFI